MLRWVAEDWLFWAPRCKLARGPRCGLMPRVCSALMCMHSSSVVCSPPTHLPRRCGGSSPPWTPCWWSETPMGRRSPPRHWCVLAGSIKAVMLRALRAAGGLASQQLLAAGIAAAGIACVVPKACVSAVRVHAAHAAAAVAAAAFPADRLMPGLFVLPPI